jgi:CheY-like chemotaxis protein/nitrogen-specific signal transduction histidine kinase
MAGSSGMSEHFVKEAKGNSRYDPQLESLTMLARGVAHEVGNLMATIVGRAGLLRDTLASYPEALSTLDIIEESAYKASALTRESLGFAKPKPTTATGGPRTKLNNIVYHAFLAEEQHLAPRIRIARYIDPDMMDVVGERTRIARIVLALLSNAVEAIPGEGRISIRTRNVSFAEDTVRLGTSIKAGDYACISIKDTGVGMDYAAQQALFASHDSSKEGLQGEELTFMHKQARAYGGFILVQSEVDIGTEISVYLPALPSLPEEEAKSLSHLHASKAPASWSRGSETILVVDDEKHIRGVLEQSLHVLGYKTLLAENGEKAVKIAQNYPETIHLTLLDMSMPVMSGSEAYPLLKEARPEMPIIICTALDKDTVDEPLPDLGPNSFLPKPFQIAALSRQLRVHLDAPAS